MGPPGGGRMIISKRLQSRFNLINMTFPAGTYYLHEIWLLSIQNFSNLFSSIQIITFGIKLEINVDSQSFSHK